jgi:predicted nucleic acid-binding protein
LPDPLKLCVYLDANILFSASYKPESQFLKFWCLRGIIPITSVYAIGEVTRNIKVTGHEARFAALLQRTQIVSDADIRLIPIQVKIAAKDAAILTAAIGAGADYLATGDKQHFAHLYNTTVSGVHILDPSDFLALHADRLSR